MNKTIKKKTGKISGAKGGKTLSWEYNIKRFKEKLGKDFDKIEYIKSSDYDGLWASDSDMVTKFITSSSNGEKKTMSISYIQQRKRLLLYKVDGKMQPPTMIGPYLNRLFYSKEVYSKYKSGIPMPVKRNSITWEEFESRIDPEWFNHFDKIEKHSNAPYEGFFRKDGTPWKPDAGRYNNSRNKLRGRKKNKYVTFVNSKTGEKRRKQIIKNTSLDYTRTPEIMGRDKALGKEEVLRRCEKIHADKYTYVNIPQYAKLSNRKNPEDAELKYICKKHIEEGVITQLICAHIGRKSGCPYCAESEGEKEVRKALKLIGLVPNKITEPRWFKSQFHIPGFIYSDGSEPRLDFYLEINGKPVVIEFHGEQHFKYIPHLHYNDIKNFIILQKRDEDKRVFTKDNNIQYLEVTYKDFDNVYNIVKDFIDGI